MDVKQVSAHIDKLAKVLEEAKINEANLAGQIKSATDRLVALGIKSVGAAQKEIATLEKEQLDLGNQIDEKYNKLRENYEW